MGMPVTILRRRLKRVALAIVFVIALALGAHYVDNLLNIDALWSPAQRTEQPHPASASERGADLTPSTTQIGGEFRSNLTVTQQYVGAPLEHANSIAELLDDVHSQGVTDKRLEAISRLASQVDPLAELALVSLLDDHNPSIREETVEALAALGSGPAIQGLGYALSDADVSIRIIAMEMLAEIGTDDAVYSLTMTLSDEDPALREAAVYEIADVDSPAAAALLELFLLDNDPEVRQLAAEHLFVHSEMRP